jgi:23S rRNA (guanosine2251-2'-O)-methyltransferase
MAGNSQRRGATRKPGSKKGATVGSGGQRRAKLEGRGPTPKAEDRPHHVAAKRKRAAARARTTPTRTNRSSTYLFGRNPVVEALRAGVPATTLYVQSKGDADERIREAIDLANASGIALLEAPRGEMDSLADGGVHQGLLLVVPEYRYADLDDVAGSSLLIALDGVTDTRNLGAIARSGAAFGAGGIVVPSRRSVTVTAASWKASAGALTRVPVAEVTNLTRSDRGGHRLRGFGRLPPGGRDM